MAQLQSRANCAPHTSDILEGHGSGCSGGSGAASEASAQGLVAVEAAAPGVEAVAPIEASLAPAVEAAATAVKASRSGEPIDDSIEADLEAILAAGDEANIEGKLKQLAGQQRWVRQRRRPGPVCIWGVGWGTVS